MQGLSPHRFAPAAPDETYVFGSCAPGWHTAAGHETALDDWLDYVQEQGIERVCCLLPGQQLDATGLNVDRYQSTFGESRVCHAPVPDHHLVSEERLHREILPFLADARDAEERTVVHCLAGIGRTGQVLAAWLVYNRDYGPDRAVETVREMGREPRDAIEAGNADRGDLTALLASVARL
jgi:protein-tyrosine phosphatase